MLRPHRRWLYLAWLAGLAAGFATIAFAGTIAWLIQQSLFAPTPTPLLPWFALALAALVARHALQALGNWGGQKLALAVRADVRAGMIHNAARIGPFHLAHRGHSGAWASRYQEQVDALAGFFARYLPALGLAVLVPLALLAAVFTLDWVAGLLLLVSAPLIPVFMALIGMGSQKIHEAQQERQNRLAGHFLDRIRALDLLRRSLALEIAQQEIAETAQDYRRLSMRVLRVAFLSSAVMEFFSAVAIGLIAIYVGFALLGFLQFGPAGAMTLFTGLFVLLLAPDYFQPLRQFAQTYHDRASALAAAAALAPLFAPPQVPAQAEALPEGDAPMVLRLANVRLQYTPDAQPVLDGVELSIPPGAQIALVGPSGSGKSTLLAVCAGFLAPDAGSVMRSQTARRFAWIGQRTHLFHGTLRDNLLLGADAHATDADLIEALTAAGLPVDDPTLPAGLNTLIGEGNRGLSGGQAQRVALARALLADSHLWLLDEPTSALDFDTAEDLLTRLLSHARARGITMLLATHQASIYRRLPRILRVEQGKLLEFAGD